jgi:hypothetical protein
MGEIVYKTLIRLALSIFVLWGVRGYFDEKFFWIISILAIYFSTIYPAYASYRNFIERNENIITTTLCSSCKYFDESAILCIKYDKHPTENFIPCEGKDWKPKSNNDLTPDEI